jgi:crossover junction endodeoxyribonuclease RuvC
VIVLGIDPGQSGGLAWISTNTDEALGNVHAVKMPETERDTWEWLCEFGAENFAVIEKVHSMPKQGVASVFKFGRSYGFLRGCLIASGIPFEEVTPQAWQKEMGCLTRGDKNVSKAKAQQLFPTMKITHAVADALLLAAYAQRLYQQRSGTK